MRSEPESRHPSGSARTTAGRPRGPRRRHIAGLVLGLTTIGCVAVDGPSRTVLETGDPLLPTAVVELKDSQDLRYGELRAANVKVINSTRDAILLRSVELDDQLPEFFQLPTAFQGNLRAEKALGRWSYDPDAPGVTPAVFEDNWLLLPGEARVVEIIFRARLFTQPLRIYFRRVPSADLAEQVYFPVEDPHDTGRIRYETLPASRLHLYRQQEAGTLGRVVLIPDETVWPLEMASVSITVPIVDASTPGRVVATLGASVRSRVSRWLQVGRWIVEDPESGEVFAVDENVVRTPLPSCELLVFDIFDRIALVEERGSIPVFAADTPEPVELVVTAEIEEFLERARARGDGVLAHWIHGHDGRFDYGVLLESHGESPGTGATSAPSSPDEPAADPETSAPAGESSPVDPAVDAPAPRSPPDSGQPPEADRSEANR